MGEKKYIGRKMKKRKQEREKNMRGGGHAEWHIVFGGGVRVNAPMFCRKGIHCTALN